MGGSRLPLRVEGELGFASLTGQVASEQDTGSWIRILCVHEEGGKHRPVSSGFGHGEEIVATVQIGPLTLHTNTVGWEPAAGVHVGSDKCDGESLAAVVTGPGGLELDLAFFMGDTGLGQVHCPDPAGVPADYARLAHGGRLGVYSGDDGLLIVRQLRLLRFSVGSGWGNPTKTDLHELDQLLGGSVERLLCDLGASGLGTKEDVLGERGSDLVMTWNTGAGPELPLAAYTLTRVLPIYVAVNR